MRKVVALLLKPVSPILSKKGLLWSFYRYTDRGTKVLRYWEILQRLGAYECNNNHITTNNTRWHIRQRQFTAQRMHLVILDLKYSMHTTATERRWARLHYKTRRAKKLVLLTTPSSSLRCASAAEHRTAEQYSKTGKNDLRRSDRLWNTSYNYEILCM